MYIILLTTSRGVNGPGNFDKISRWTGFESAVSQKSAKKHFFAKKLHTVMLWRGFGVQTQGNKRVAFS